MGAHKTETGMSAITTITGAIINVKGKCGKVALLIDDRTLLMLTVTDAREIAEALTESAIEAAK